jgi:hypothetical protein
VITFTPQLHWCISARDTVLCLYQVTVQKSFDSEMAFSLRHYAFEISLEVECWNGCVNSRNVCAAATLDASNFISIYKIASVSFMLFLSGMIPECVCACVCLRVCARALSAYMWQCSHVSRYSGTSDITCIHKVKLGLNLEKVIPFDPNRLTWRAWWTVLKFPFLILFYCFLKQWLCDRSSLLFSRAFKFTLPSTLEPAYNDIGLYDTSSITSDILWYQLIPHC